ncbi:nitroreductase family deazaflavin-dependent oxidoreductase [Cellulomonas chengniuliangii]|uniref:Nitroreductase family deazaflavin-dependent oxidoreductase n=1 Tax=Cellulomonas chengniuliangii TaxID=2968084 RepID=A0ABY5L0R7_9CELL|nr:nitroreductase family deazaflavin-dependent oxidoreductase [Cellulomonas chengniuliangii]MCC2309334.1 nitroreductase family deazaflavin-dependent oxidoreductase [Cellulomonas chengniuliangii]MCC2316604.1 nitroreductase family deazaflavin-dependent oxidoreductase [Cellulomonas chengniuliangii]UUI75097.1 nitroreductase family deazaflavin-dependent oxidoreductase [Cellulomonas chengniuliangii]
MPQRPDGTDGAQPLPTFRTGRVRRALDSMVGSLVRRGLFPRSYMLTTIGRRSGRPITHPVTPVEHDGRRWLVSPYGQVSWVHNARAAGRVSLQRGGRTEECTVRELGPREAAPVLKQYLAITGPPRRYFRADRKAPVAEFAAEAHEHPVFEIVPVG